MASRQQLASKPLKILGRMPGVAAGDMGAPGLLWDGDLADALPIASAFALGATHVVALFNLCNPQRTAPPHPLERHWLQHKVARKNPALAQAMQNRWHQLAATLGRYTADSRVLIVQPQHAPVGVTTRQEKALWQGVLTGWHTFGAALDLPSQPLPPAWQPWLAEHKLAATT